MLGVVSATPNVGKSFIAANLAASMSRDPRIQAYLVDLDLRRSAIKDIFGIETQEGLSDFLAAPDMSSRLPTFRPHDQKLIIVPNVAGENLSAEHLAGKRARLLRAMRASDQPNYFIFDLPPVFANDDAITTMDMLDAYVLIAEEGRTTQGEIESAVEMLGEQRLAGVILNKYRGGLISDGRGLEDRYAKGYYAGEGDDEPA
jgi:Mrp family chromosome partitioning ATPase